MSDFIFIIPEGWTQLNIDEVTSAIQMTQIQDYLNTQSWLYLGDDLKNASLIPQEAYLHEAKMFNAEVFIVRLG
jgi:hypothetical protein